MAEWQPIETAPSAEEDFGRRVIIFDPRLKEPVQITLADGGWWRYRKERDGATSPTHWMPLPEPPLTHREKKGAE